MREKREKKVVFTSSVMDLKPGSIFQRPRASVAYKILKRDFIAADGTAHYTAVEVPGTGK